MARTCDVKHPWFLERSVFRGKQNSATTVGWKQIFHLRIAFLPNPIFILEGQIKNCIWQAQAEEAECVLSQKRTSLKLMWWTFQMGCERFRLWQTKTAWLKMSAIVFHFLLKKYFKIYTKWNSIFPICQLLVKEEVKSEQMPVCMRRENDSWNGIKTSYSVSISTLFMLKIAKVCVQSLQIWLRKP